MNIHQHCANGLIALALLSAHADAQSLDDEPARQWKLTSWFDATDYAPADDPAGNDVEGAYRIAALQAQAQASTIPSSNAATQSSRARSPSRSSRRSPRSGSRFTALTSSQRASAARSAAFVSLATVPFMIGDTASGSCSTVSFRGAIDGNIEHPTLACSRLNISENNSALLLDRYYVSYRHFHNVSETDIFEEANDLSVDRVMFGVERTYFDGGFSMELRVPVSRELSSNFDIVLNGADPTLDTLPLNERSTEFGNISLIMKKRLYQSDRFMLSGGLAFQLPTADDVLARGDLDANFIIIDDLFPALDAFVDLEFNVRVQNETVNFSPFLAWLWAPTERCFQQGFLQVDVPANPSDVSGEFNGVINPVLVPGGALAPIPVNVANRAKLHQQTLLRVNMNVGYKFYHDPMANWLRAISGMVELHYTTTLQDAKLVTTPLFAYDYLGNPLPVDFTLGNGANRVDMLNLAVGNSIQIGKTTITNGFVMPLTTGSNKAFDAEYNFQLQRQF